MSPTEQGVISPTSRILDTRTALFLLAAMIFLYSLLFVLPFIPIDHHIDGLILVADGKRMYEGKVMYRDFFQFTTPGTPLVYFLLFKLLGLRLWIPDLTLLLLGLGLVWLGVVIARKLMRPGLALLPSAIFLAAVYRNNLDPTHHWYSLVTTAAAIAVLMERRTPARIATTGFLCGLTACFTQSRGLAVVVGFGAFLWWESRQRREEWRELLKKEVCLVAPFLATLITVNAYFVWKAGLARFLWCTVVFGIKYYPKDAEVNTFRIFIGDLPRLSWLTEILPLHLAQWLFLYVVVPFTYILFLVRYWRESGKKSLEYWERPMLLAIVGSFMLLSVAPAPGIHRMAQIVFPGVILVGWFIDSPRQLARALASVLVVGVLLVAPHAVASAQSAPKRILKTPHGKLAVMNPRAFEEYTWIQQHTRPSEYFFDAWYPEVYFYLHLRNPTPLPYISNTGYTTRQQVAEVMQGLEQHDVRYILWPGFLDTIPAWEDRSDDHLGPLRNYLQTHYRRVKGFKETDEIWERRD